MHYSRPITAEPGRKKDNSDSEKEKQTDSAMGNMVNEKTLRRLGRVKSK